MNADEIRARVAQIKQEAADGDYEAAHGSEDNLHEAVLTAIAEGAPDAPELAREALATRQIRFNRYAA